MARSVTAATAVDFILCIYSHQEGTQKDASAQTHRKLFMMGTNRNALKRKV